MSTRELPNCRTKRTCEVPAISRPIRDESFFRCSNPTCGYSAHVKQPGFVWRRRWSTRWFVRETGQPLPVTWGWPQRVTYDSNHGIVVGQTFFPWVKRSFWVSRIRSTSQYVEVISRTTPGPCIIMRRGIRCFALTRSGNKCGHIASGIRDGYPVCALHATTTKLRPRRSLNQKQLGALAVRFDDLTERGLQR